MIHLRTIAQVGLAATCLAVASVGIGWGTAHAQIGGGGGGFGGGGMGATVRSGGQGVIGPQSPMGAIGAPAVVQDDQYLYIVRGGQVLKVQKSTLTTVLSANLPPSNLRWNGSGGSGGQGGGSQQVPPPQ